MFQNDAKRQETCVECDFEVFWAPLVWNLPPGRGSPRYSPKSTAPRLGAILGALHRESKTESIPPRAPRAPALQTAVPSPICERRDLFVD